MLILNVTDEFSTIPNFIIMLGLQVELAEKALFGGNSTLTTDE